MSENLRLEQNLGLSQRLTPQQVQFVRFLEMTEPQIEEEVRHAMDENQAIERADSADDVPEADGDFSESSTELQRADYRDDDTPEYLRHARNRSADDPDYSPMAVADGPSLAESLADQLAELDLPADVLRAATYIIGNIDSNGYLKRSLADIADDIAVDTGDLPDKDTVKAAFRALRTLDPPGVCAVDLRDCLLLQLQRRRPRTVDVKIATEIVDMYFDLFSEHHYDQLRRELDLPDADALQGAFHIIRSLDPKPGSAFDSGSDKVRHISPDFLVEADDDGRFTVSSLSRVPRLQVAESFNIGDAGDDDTNARRRQELAFIRNRVAEATMFIDNIAKRQRTLMAVMTAIVGLQPDFFASGDAADIRPMVLKDIADVTGLDISVISRAISGKYVATAGGTFPLRMFLNERMTEGSDVSSHQIRRAIREIVDGEDKRHPLSDRAIHEALVARGYAIERRTVSKYRERIGIPIARLRKNL